MAQIARNGAGKAAGAAEQASDNVTELAGRTVRQAHQATMRPGVPDGPRADEVEHAAARRSTDGTVAPGFGFVALADEQARHNLETLKALTGAVAWNQVARAVDWPQLLRIQSSYLRASLERTVRLHQHLLQASQALMTSMAATTRRRADKAA